MIKKVCIVGAGASGLVSAKELMERGIEVEILEKRREFGGLWNMTPDLPSFTLNMYATSSKAFLAFSDTPFDESVRDFPHSTEYIAYLERYIQTHKIAPHLRFGHEVKSIRKVGERWTVTSLHEGQERVGTYDAVTVCTGFHHVPLFPDVFQNADFKGEIVHSGGTKSVARMAGKRVLVVGAGESAADYTHELAMAGAHTFMSLKRGIAVTRHVGPTGHPGDFDSTRAKVWLPRDYLHDYNVDCRLEDRDGAFKTLYTLLGLPILLPMSLVYPKQASPLLRSLTRKDAWLSLFRPPRRFGPASGVELSEACAKVVATPATSEEEIAARAWKIKYLFDWYSGTGHNSQPFTKQDSFLHDIAAGKVRVVPQVVGFKGGNTVLLDGGETVEIDVVLLCTGYRTFLPFLEQPAVDGRSLFKNVFNPADPSLAFVGFLRPNVGSLPALCEMQARWLAAVWSGLVTLPKGPELQARIDEDARLYTEGRPHHHKRVTALVDYHLYMESIARMLGVRPRVWTLLSRPRLWYQAIFGPLGCFQYRFSGPGANPQAAEEAMNRLPPPQAWRVMRHTVLLMMKPWFHLLSWMGRRELRPEL